MKRLPTTRLSSAEARKLSSFLRSEKVPQNTLTLNQLKGYLLCICAAPEMLQPSFWLPPIFAGKDETLIFEFEEDFIYIELIMRLYNQINTEVLEGNPTLPGNCRLDKTVSNNFNPGNALHEWSRGFDIGLNITAFCWQDLPLKELDLAEEVESLWMLLSFFADEQRARTAKAAKLETLPFDQMLAVLRQQLPWLIKDYAKLGRTFYEVRYSIDQASGDIIQFSYKPSSFQTPPNNSDDNAMPTADILIRAAYDASNPSEIVTLANQALKLNPNCVDAFLLLAEWDARNEQEHINFLQLAISAGEKEFGPDYFEKHAGNFWGLPETRPYMQALSDLATIYKHNKKPSQAIGLLEKALHLNPNDNQGNRHCLVTLYLEQQQLEQAEALLDQYPRDRSAFMLFSRLLLHYIRYGDSDNSRRLRKAANRYNKYVARYLNDHNKIPKNPPAYYGVGDRNEAIIYAMDNHELWRKVVGATPWLLK